MEAVTRINRGRSWLACGLCCNPSPGYGVQSTSPMSRVDAAMRWAAAKMTAGCLVSEQVVMGEAGWRRQSGSVGVGDERTPRNKQRNIRDYGGLDSSKWAKPLRGDAMQDLRRIVAGLCEGGMSQPACQPALKCGVVWVWFWGSPGRPVGVRSLAAAKWLTFIRIGWQKAATPLLGHR